MARTVRTITAVAVVAAVILAVLAVAARQFPLLGGGPLREPPPHGWSTTAAVGETFTDGLEVLYFPGIDDPAVLESVELIGGDGLEVVGWQLNGPRRNGNHMSLAGFPPQHRELTDVRPGDTPMSSTRDGWELLLGIKVTKPGYLVRDGIRITYTVNGWTYARDHPAYLAVCTSRDQWRNGECPPPKGP